MRIKVSRKKKRNKVVTIVTALAAIFIFAGSLSLIYLKLKAVSFTFINYQPSQTPTPPLFEHMRYLVPVVGFTNRLDEITYEELKSMKLFTTPANRKFVPPDLDCEMLPLDTVLENNLAEGNILLLSPEEVKPWFKTLKLDGQLYWSKNFDPKTYKLTGSELLETTPTPEYDRKTIFAGGEIIPARAVDRLGLNKYNNYTYLFDFVAKELKNADLSIAMLENPLKGNPSPCTGCVVFVGDDQFAKGLADVGFDMLSLSGNHAGDGGQSGYSNTIKLMDANNIQHTGTGKTTAEVLTPAIGQLGKIKVGMLAADDIAYFYWDKNTTDSYYGSNSFSTISGGITKSDDERIQQITRIKAENDIDYLIIYMSWGIEYTNKPTSHQVELAKKLIDAGADMILASHVHWTQSIEFYKDKPIVYGMGNFIFDQTHTVPTRQSFTLNLYFNNNELKHMEIMPMQTCGYHQTKNDLTPKYLNKELTLEQVYTTDEKSGCVYWQPKKLRSDHPSYQEIINRVFEYTKQYVPEPTATPVV